MINVLVKMIHITRTALDGVEWIVTRTVRFMGPHVDLTFLITHACLIFLLSMYIIKSLVI